MLCRIEIQMIECNLCAELKNEHLLNGFNLKNLFEDEFILYSDNFFSIVPSIGALNDSHILIVPNRHVKNFLSLSNSEKQHLLKILPKIENYYLEKFQSQVLFFEHGTGFSNRKNCIEHAHIHCVLDHKKVLPFFLDNLVVTKLSQPFFTDNLELTSITQSGYIWFKNNMGEWVGTDKDIKSQYLRYLYKTAIGETGWDWRVDKKISSIKKVILNFKNLI